MNSILLSSIIGALILSLFKYYESYICYICSKRGRGLVSFLVGATIIVIFLELLDDVYLKVHETNPLILVFLPIAFIILMLIERHIHGEKNRWQRKNELRMLLRVISFSSGFIIGMVSILDMQVDLFKHLIFIAFLLSYDFIRELSIHLIERPKKRNTQQKISYALYCLSPVYGLATAYLLPITPIAEAILLSLFSGAIIYILVKEVVVDREQKVEPVPLVIGAFSLIFIFLLSAML